MHQVFKSLYGYNSQIREGKIYNFSREGLKYLLEVNLDLINLNFWFKLFSLKIKKYLFIKYLSNKYKGIYNFIHKRELGFTNIYIEKNKYKLLYKTFY